MKARGSAGSRRLRELREAEVQYLYRAVLTDLVRRL